jgi:hypothetical protein
MQAGAAHRQNLGSTLDVIAAVSLLCRLRWLNARSIFNALGVLRPAAFSPSLCE